MDKFYHLAVGIVLYKLFRLMGIHKVSSVIFILLIGAGRELYNFQGYESVKDLLATILLPYILMRTEKTKELKNES